MKTKFKMKQSNMIKILLGVLVFLLGAYIVAVVASMISKAEFVFASLLFPIFFTAVLVIVLVTFAKSNYAVKGANLILSLSLARTTILLETVTTIKYLKTTNELIICHFVKENPRLHLVQIAASDFDDFVKAMRNARPQIIYQEILDNAV